MSQRSNHPQRDEINHIAEILMNAWAKAEPDHGVTKHPTSYIATFVDMARAVIDAGFQPAKSPRAGQLTTREAARQAGVTDVSIRRWIVDGVLSSVNVGGRWLISRHDLDRLIADRPARVLHVKIDDAKVKELRAEGASWRSIAGRLGCSVRTARRRALGRDRLPGAMENVMTRDL